MWPWRAVQALRETLGRTVVRPFGRVFGHAVGTGPGRSRFARNVWQVARANVLAQLLPVLAAPLLTRLYSPADFGAAAIFAAVLGFALAVGTGRFEWSVPSARSAGMAAALLVCGLVVLLLATPIAALAWWLAANGAAGPEAATAAGSAGRWLPQALSPTGAAMAAALLALAMAGAGAQQMLSAWHVRSADLSAVGRSKVTRSIANVAAALAGASFGWWGLIAGLVAGAWVGLGTLIRQAHGLTGQLGRLTRPRLAAAARRYRAEAAWSTLASALNTATFAVAPLMLARHYSAAEVGYFALMQRVALGPIGLIGSAVSQSFWAEAAQLLRRDVPALRLLYRRSTLRLAWVALPLALLALAGPLYIGLLFGAEAWQAAGWVLAASVPMLVGQAVISPLSHLIVHGRQHWQALWDAARVLLLVLAIEGLGRAGAPFAATVFGLSMVMGVMYLVLFALNHAALNRAGPRQ